MNLVHRVEMEIQEEMVMWEVLANKEQQVHKVHRDHKVQRVIKEEMVRRVILVRQDFRVSLDAAVRKVLRVMTDLLESQAPKGNQVCI